MTTLTATAPKANRAGSRMAALGGAALIGAALVAVLTFALPEDSVAAAVLLDRGGRFPYPFTIQNAMWIVFFMGLVELILRFRSASQEARQVSMALLPEDDETMLRAQDLAPYSAKAKANLATRESFLQRLVVRIIWQFQSTRSVSQSNDILNSSLELFQHEIDLRYNMIRYITWLIPTLGFIGTVIGIAFALETAGDPPDVSDTGALRPWMQALTRDLGVAFNTTLVALLLSAVLVFIMHVAQEREELALNRAGQYCLDNLINRLYEK